MTKTFKKTKTQEEAVKLLSGKHKHIMLYGGSRSGKTFILVYAIVLRAMKRKSRHVILRAVFSHAKTSIWYDTLPKVMDICFPDVPYYQNKSDWYYRLPNGSTIWIGGLDDKERTEKILGNEYSTIYFNEASQMSYHSVAMVHSRLAEKSGLSNKFYYDCNPPYKSHWTYTVFKKYINPLSKEAKKLSKDVYTSMMLHPDGNRENLADGYIEDILENYDEDNKRRFLDGEWGEINNRMVMKNWEIGGNIEYKDGVPFLGEFNLKRIPSGMDFGYNPDPCTLTDFYICGENTLVWDSIIYENNLTMIRGSNPLQPTVQQRLEETNFSKQHLIIADSARKDSITELRGEGYNVFAVQKPRIEDSLNMLLSFNHIITERSQDIINEFENYIKAIDKEGNILPMPIDKWNHAIDSARYVLVMRGRMW